MTDDEVLQTIIAHEGSVYSDDPDDRGGPTKFGITQNELSHWRGHQVSKEDVMNLEQSEAEDIYRRLYISPFTLLEGMLRANVIDFGVNAGVPRAALLLQEVVGARVDGIVGSETVKLSQLRDWNSLFTGARLTFYEGLLLKNPSQTKYRNGWRNRSLSFIAPSAPRRLSHVGLALYGRTGKAYA